MTTDLDEELARASRFPPALPRDFAATVMGRIQRDNPAAGFFSPPAVLALALAAALLGGIIGAAPHGEAPEVTPPSMALFGSDFLATP